MLMSNCLPHDLLPNVNKLEAVHDVKNWKFGILEGGVFCRDIFYDLRNEE